MPSWKKACFWLLVPVGSTVLAWAVFTRIEPRNPNTWRAVGYMILSVEGLIVTWFWPRLFPIRRAHRSRHRHHRDGVFDDRYRHRDEIIQLAMASFFVSSLGGGDDERRRSQRYARELSSSWSDSEWSRAALSDSARSLASSRSDCGEDTSARASPFYRGNGGHRKMSLSTWGALVSSLKVLLTPHSRLSIEQRRARTGWVRRFFLVLFALSASCTTSQVVFPGKLIWMPFSGDPSVEGIATIGGRASPGERGMDPAVLEYEEAESIERTGEGNCDGVPRVEKRAYGENPSRQEEKEGGQEDKETRARKKKDGSTQNKWRRQLKLGDKTNGREDSATAEEAAKAAAKATTAAEAAAKAAAVAEAAAKAAAAAAAAAAATAAAADATAAVKVEREQVELIDEKKDKVKTTSQASRYFLKRILLRPWRDASATRATAPENTRRQRLGEGERALEELARAGEQGAAPETATLHEGQSLGVEQVLLNGSTKMWMMASGDAVLFFDGVLVWEAQGSKKRRTVLGWIWRKIRRRASLSQCSKCRLTVTSNGRLEIRDKRKLLWSDGQLNQKNNRTKNRKGHVSAVAEMNAPEDAEKQPSEGDAGSGTYRLEVTNDGNAVLKRGDFEVVWWALNK